MPRSARTVQADDDPKPNTEVYRATLQPSGKIIVVRTPARKRVDNTFVFKNSAEMRTTLSGGRRVRDVNSLMRELADTGSARFAASR